MNFLQDWRKTTNLITEKFISLDYIVIQNQGYTCRGAVSAINSSHAYRSMEYFQQVSVTFIEESTGTTISIGSKRMLKVRFIHKILYKITKILS